MKSIVRTSLCFLLLAHGSAHAAGAYLGGSLGSAASFDARSNVKDAKAVLASVNPASTVSYDETSPTGALAAGVEFNSYLAAELGIAFLGTYKLSGSAGSGPTSVTVDEKDTVGAISLAMIGKYPIWRKIKFLAKVGLGVTSVEKTCSIASAVCASETDSGVHPVFGAGVALRPINALEIRLDVTVYTDVGKTDNDYTAGTFGVAQTSLYYHF